MPDTSNIRAAALHRSSARRLLEMARIVRSLGNTRLADLYEHRASLHNIYANDLSITREMAVVPEEATPVRS